MPAWHATEARSLISALLSMSGTDGLDLKLGWLADAISGCLLAAHLNCMVILNPVLTSSFSSTTICREAARRCLTVESGFARRNCRKMHQGLRSSTMPLPECPQPPHTEELQAKIYIYDWGLLLPGAQGQQPQV